MPVTKVVVDPNAPFKSPRNKFPLKGRSIRATAARQSNASMSDIRDSTERLDRTADQVRKDDNRKLETASAPLSPAKRIAFSSPQRNKLKQRRVCVRPELQLAVAQASAGDQETYQACAEILEKVLTAVEEGKTSVNLDDSFGADAKVNDSQLLPGGRRKDMPRYLQANYMSRKTQQRLEREAAEKTASEVPVDPEVVK